MPDCGGLGTRRDVSEELVLGDPRISILEGVILPWGEPTGYLRKVVLPALAQGSSSSTSTRRGASSPQRRSDALLHGAPGRFKLQTDGARGRGEYESDWEGVLANVERRYEESSSDAVRMELEEFMIEVPCQTCGGQRLKPESARGHGRTARTSATSSTSRSPSARRSSRASRCASNGRAAGLDPEIAGPILKEVRERLRFLVDVGLDYLTLGRARRVALGRRGAAHPAGDADRLAPRRRALHPRRAVDRAAPARQRAPARTLEQLRDLGNTVIVVEHDEETMRAADHVIDLGPRRGQASAAR